MSRDSLTSSLVERDRVLESPAEEVRRIAQEVSRVRQELKGGGNWDLDARIRWLRNFDAALIGAKEFILATVAREKGVSEHNVLLNEYIPTRLLIQYYLKTARRVLRDEDRSRPASFNFGNLRAIVRKRPLGVVGVISPFNYPFSLPLGPVISALLGGNAVILKPAEQTPQTNLLISALVAGTLAKSGSKDLFGILPSAVDYGKALVSEPLVSKIHFTGSVAGGWKIAQANAQVRLTPPTLELGGSNAAIVLEDADLDNAAKTIVWARYCGQSCNAIKRVFAVASVYDALWKRLEAGVAALRSHEIVTKYSEAEQKNFRAFVNDYVMRNPEMDVPAWRDGYDCPVIPALFRIEQYDPNLLMLKEETFVPILPVVRVRDAKEAVARTNDSQYGLGASVFTRDKHLFRLVANELEAGGVNHNAALTEFAQGQLPFGGIRNSGSGYTHGPEGLLDFVWLEPVIEEGKVLGLFPAPKPQLYPWTEKAMRTLRRFADLLIRLG